MSTPQKQLEDELELKFHDTDYSFKCWVCKGFAFKYEDNGDGGPLFCKCDWSYNQLLKAWPAHKKLLLDAFNRQNAESKKGKLYDESAVTKALESEDPNIDTDVYLTIIVDFLTKLDAKHNDKFKKKLDKVIKDKMVKPWLSLMKNHVGNPEDYLV